jgi:putative alpha-1,2-mannosidase
LGAWYVLTALGLFDVQGHANMNPTFQFGSPMFDQVTITLNQKYYKGKSLIIKTVNNSKSNIYIQNVRWNNQKIEQCWINRDQLMKGGTLLFEMGEKPNYNWGIKTPPPSMTK